MTRRLLSIVPLLVAGLAADAGAQGLQNGVITGAVHSSDGLSLPGVTVTVSSPSLQGTRSATTDINGNYVIRGLPPGDYAVAFELQGMSPKTEKSVVELGRTTSVDSPRSFGVINWSGVLSPKMFATAQWSRKKFGFRNSGGKSTLLRDSPFRTPSGNGIPQSLLYSSPYFDGNDPEDRDNHQLTGSLSYYLSTKSLGSHDIKGGVEWFRSSYSGGNSQSPTGYVYWSNYLTDVEGKPVMDAQGRFIPDFVPGVSWLFNWQAARGAQMDTDTNSIYLHDRWAYNRHLTLDLGARYERVCSEAIGEIVGADTDTWVPRLAASYDRGDGRFVAQATYAHYAGKYSEAQFTSNTDVGNPSLVWYGYTGPAGQGLGFEPGFDPANYSDILFGSFATANVFFEDGLSSAVNKEFTVSFGSEIGKRGYGKATFVRRRTSDIIDDFIDTTTGATEVIRNGVNFGIFDNIVYRNAPDDLFREYRALVFQGRYRLSNRWLVEGHWTLQLKNDGNTEGELSNQPRRALGVRRLSRGVQRDAPLPNRPRGRLPALEGSAMDDLHARPWTVRRCRPHRSLALQHRPDLQPGRDGGAAD